jgi:hypothetical protein
MAPLVISDNRFDIVAGVTVATAYVTPHSKWGVVNVPISSIAGQ